MPAHFMHEWPPASPEYEAGRENVVQNTSSPKSGPLSRNESTFHVLAGVNVPSRFCFKVPPLCDHPDRIPFRTRTSPPARSP